MSNRETLNLKRADIYQAGDVMINCIDIVLALNVMAEQLIGKQSFGTGMKQINYTRLILVIPWMFLLILKKVPITR